MAPRLIYGHDRVVAEFVASKIEGFDSSLDKNDYVAIGVVENGGLIAGVIYNEYRPPVDIRESFASISPTWATKYTLKHLFAYPFIHLGVRRMSSVVDVANVASVDLTERLGFKREGVIRKAMDNGNDAIMFGMLKEECPWIKSLLQK